MRLVQEGMLAVTLGLVETLRPGDTTTGMPFAKVGGERARRAVRERKVMVNMLREYEWDALHPDVHLSVETLWG